ncbi:MAG: hypothetical protein ACFFDK_09595 [Promethearchaeota archaeon]
MKKKLVYGIIFLTIFLMSTLSTTRPALAYKFGVPKEAKGVKTESQVKLFDQDEWDKHLGKEASEPDDYFYGDADKVDAKSRTKVLEWKEDKRQIDFFADFVLKAEVEVEDTPEITDFNSVFDYIYNGITGLSDLTSEGPVLVAVALSVALAPGGFQTAPAGDPKNWTWTNASDAFYLAQDYPITTDYINEKYPEKLDGTILKRDFWEFTDEPYKANPDRLKEKIPFLADPHDWYDTYKKLRNVKDELLSNIEPLVETIIAINTSINQLSPTDWSNLNTSVANLLTGPLGGFIVLPQIGEANPGVENLPWMLLESSLKADGTNFLQNGTTGLLAISDLVGTQIPGKFGFLFNLLTEGLPTYTPVHDFLARIADDFDINDRAVEVGIPGLDPSVKVRGDVDVDGNAITLKFEYPDGTVDPANPDKKLKDWEVTFTYGDMGTQESVSFKDDDGTEFYRLESLPMDYLQIPAVRYLLYLVGGISAAVIIGLIYVVMRRRRNRE